MNCSITHIAVYAKDLEKIKNFYVTYFNGVANKKYVNSTGFSSYFVEFSGGPRIEVMAHKELQEITPMDRVNGYNHIAFSVGSRERVIELTEELVKDGYELLSPVRETGDGYFESCVADPEGNRVEITV